MLKHVTASEDWNRKTLGAKGFTLVELLVVIVILGILAAVVVFAVAGVTNRGEDSACETELRSVRTAAQAHYAQNGSYPAGVGDLVPEFLDETPTATYTINSSTGAVTRTPAC